MTDRNDGRPRHSASHMHCAVPFFCARSGTEGEAGRRCGEWVVRAERNASRSLRACVGAVWGSGSAREGRVAVLGREHIFGGEWVVRSAGFNALSPQRLARTRIIIYVRRATAMRSQPWGRKGAPANAHRPRRLPHPPRLRLYFRSGVHTAPAYPSAAPTKTLASRSSSYPQWVIHGKVIHIVAHRPVQNVLVLAPAHAYI